MKRDPLESQWFPPSPIPPGWSRRLAPETIWSHIRDLRTRPSEGSTAAISGLFIILDMLRGNRKLRERGHE